MQPQQLQFARAALWRHNDAPLVTLDDAAQWLDQIGLCLFLPRPAQLPAPAPSFVEACLGTSSAAPTPGAVATATELATRLVAAGRGLPLNLLGSFSEQPDFLIAPDVLPWVAAIRGDRQWKSAPGARTAPIVLRTWEALDQHGPQTAAELQERLGRELTEAAVLRALIELWTSLRALPAYAAGEPTRWDLLKNRYAPQLTVAANTAQPTALSAVISLYLRSAIAATAEEIEIFLSPLTARSRIRDVVHGMTAARQLASMSVGSHTLLFIEGSLPETIPASESEPASAAPAATREEDRARRESIRKHPRQDLPPRSERPNRSFRPDRSVRPAAGAGSRPPRRDFRPGASRDNAKPWQKRSAGPFRSRQDRPPFQRRDAAAGPPHTDRPQSNRPLFDRSRSDRPQTGRPWQKDRPAGPRSAKKFGARPGFARPAPGSPRFADAPRNADAPTERPAPFEPRKFAPRKPGPGQFGPKKFGAGKFGPKKFGAAKSGPNQFGPKKFAPKKFASGKFSRAQSGPGKFPRFRSGQPRPEERGAADARPANLRPTRPGARKFAPGPRNTEERGPARADKFPPARRGRAPGEKSGFRKPSPGGPNSGPRSGPRPFGAKNSRTFAPGAKRSGDFRAARPARPPRKNFSKPGAPPRGPRKNRKQDETPS